MSDFQKFITGLRADARLGRFIPAAMATQSPEVIVLSLVQALANAAEGIYAHPAHELLERMETPKRVAL